MKVPVSIATDMSSGWNNHLLAGAPDIVDSAAPMDWAAGGSMGKHSLATTVLHKGAQIVLDTHDLGPMLLHAPSCNPVHLVKSSRKTIFSASTVVAVKKPVACVDDSHPLMLCGDASQPMGFNHNNALHSVFVGMTSLDEFKGKAEIIKTALVDALGFGPVDGIGDLAADTFGLDPKKIALNAVVGLATSIVVSRESGWKEPITLKFEGGGGFATRTTEVSWIPDTNEWSGSDSKNRLGLKEESKISKDGAQQRSNDAPGGEMHDGPSKWGPVML